MRTPAAGTPGDLIAACFKWHRPIRELTHETTARARMLHLDGVSSRAIGSAGCSKQRAKRFMCALAKSIKEHTLIDRTIDGGGAACGQPVPSRGRLALFALALVSAVLLFSGT